VTEHRRADPAPEATTFRGDDPDCLVAAGLACRRCLSGNVDWSLRPEPWDEVVECTCRECGHRREVSLTGEQALRLALSQRSVADAAPVPLSGLATVG
jgi:hypothetical protein